MVWAAFCSNGKTPTYHMCFNPLKLMLECTYVDLLDIELMECTDNIYGDNRTYQQDNSSIHMEPVTKNFFDSV